MDFEVEEEWCRCVGVYREREEVLLRMLVVKVRGERRVDNGGEKIFIWEEG